MTWTTHRGDEWWLSETAFEATASAGPGNVTIESIHMYGSGQLSEEVLHRVLWDAQQQFHEFQLICYLSRVTRPLIESLSQKALVKWELIQNPHSQDARILDVVEPRAKPAN